jgi:hypothetical protein
MDDDGFPFGDMGILTGGQIFRDTTNSKPLD